jgi:hypothetical protein
VVDGASDAAGRGITSGTSPGTGPASFWAVHNRGEVTVDGRMIELPTMVQAERQVTAWLEADAIDKV